MVSVAFGARHHVVTGILMWSPIVLLALASAYFIGFGPSYFIGFGHSLFYWRWPLFLLRASQGQKPYFNCLIVLLAGSFMIIFLSASLYFVSKNLETNCKK